MDEEPMFQDVPTFDLSAETLRALGDEFIDLLVATFEAERNDPVLRPVSGAALRARFDEPVPQHGSSPRDIISIWKTDILPYCRRNGHPRFFGYVCTSADPLGALADAAASAMNQPVTAWRSAPVATEIERLVLRWLDELTGFGGGGAGLMTSGGSMANFQALACAITWAETRYRQKPGQRERLTVYVSSEGHLSLRKAARVLGIPDDRIRLVAIDDKRRILPDELSRIVEQDRAAGFYPLAVCASAGTANTGAIDPLEEIATLCERLGIWFHVDGSYGAPAVLAGEYRWMAGAFARADSLSLDPHKWLFAPADAGSILIRDMELLRRTFALDSEYTAVAQTGPVEGFAFFDCGLEMSRRFRALKVWTILKVRGVEDVRRVIEHDIALRRYLDQRISADPGLEDLGSELSISCFRYLPEGGGEPEEVNRLNRAILESLNAEGQCYMSPTTLDGVFALRVCIVNFRTRQEDIDTLVDAVVRLGASHTAG